MATGESGRSAGPLLSRKLCFRLAQFIGGLAATIDQRNFRVALSNLEAAFGDTFSATHAKKSRAKVTGNLPGRFSIFFGHRL